MGYLLYETDTIYIHHVTCQYHLPVASQHLHGYINKFGLDLWSATPGIIPSDAAYVIPPYVINPIHTITIKKAIFHLSFILYNP